MASEPPVFAAEALSVRFGGFQALQDVSWSVRAGRILGIIGPNGAGKSTCFQAATNMVRHTGRLLLDGQDVTAFAPHRLPKLGVRRTFQQNAFFGGMTVRDNLVGILGRDGGTPLALSVAAPSIEARRRRVMEAQAGAHLVAFGIPPEAHGKLPGELPYGAQRLLSIALACAPGARVVLLDEPGAGLGGTDLLRLRDLLVRLRNDGIAVVLIEQGRPIACGPPDAVQADPAVLEAYLGRAA